MKRWSIALAGTLMAVGGIEVVRGADDAAKPWPADVPGFVKPAPGEHPRLLFRKADLPALRKKAETPEGKAIVARLRQGNGDVLDNRLVAITL